MPIEIASTTDSEEQVTAAIGGKVEEPVKDEQKSASPDQNQDDETLKGDEESEASEKDSDEQDESEAQEDEGEDKKPKKLGNVQKRINKLTKKLSAKDQEIEYWKKAALARGEPAKVESQSETKADTSNEPNPDDFDDHNGYLKAFTKWTVDQNLKAAELKQRQAQVQEKAQEKARTFGQKLKEFSNKHDDFDELVDGVNDVLISPFVQQGIVESDYGPEIMYELAKDREEYERISSLSDAAAIRELGKIELRIIERLESKTKKRTSKTTNAPEPITPIKGRSASAKSKTIFDEDISQAEYERLRDGA